MASTPYYSEYVSPGCYCAWVEAEEFSSPTT